MLFLVIIFLSYLFNFPGVLLLSRTMFGLVTHGEMFRWLYLLGFCIIPTMECAVSLSYILLYLLGLSSWLFSSSRLLAPPPAVVVAL